MKVRDMRKEPVETLPKFCNLVGGDTFECVDSNWEHHPFAPFMVVAELGGPRAVSVKNGLFYTPPHNARVRLLKATLVLEDLGTAS